MKTASNDDTAVLKYEGIKIVERYAEQLPCDLSNDSWQFVAFPICKTHLTEGKEFG